MEAIADPDLTESPTSKESAPDSIIKVEALFPGDSNRFPRQALLLIREELEQQGEPLNEIHARIEDLEKLIQSATKEALTTAKNSLASQQLTAIASVDSAIRKKHEESKLRLERLQREAPFREEERQSIQSNIEAVEKQLTEVRAERDKILFMSWVPGLTLRVGIVVLLLFFSQILLSAYRYTISLSAFYLSRADAIQLLQPQSGRETWYDINQLSVLVKNLSPNTNDLTIDTVSSPNEQVTDLAKVWISKK
ncbi:hypothetical protein SH528x_004701 [Novipirellula sp. SH528]|uniref:hypothetical protein n=1 Tax=Novipirellula sp. SH528 TaxID=3454466 RepID=UPI003FA17540